jgi:PPOX class probable F420-dependent enzyme
VELPESARLVLESDIPAHVVTINEDGSPHVTLAWVGLEGDDVVMGTLPDQLKLRNLRRDPRIVVSMHTTNLNEYGLAEYLVVYGHAVIEEGGAPEVLRRLARTYLGPGVKFPPMPNPPPGYVTRVTVERLGGVGPWTRR